MSASRRRYSNPPKAELSDQQRADVLEAFSVFDTQKNGTIPTKDLKVGGGFLLLSQLSDSNPLFPSLQLAMRALGFEPRRDEIKKILDSCGEGESGSITYEQFVGIMSEKITEKDAREEILKAFHLFDDDQTGKISFKNLQRVAAELGETLNEDELREMIQEADQDQDGEINQEEFLRIMKKTCLY